ncbi:mandelate racemase/muconate lactonizing enzyme family protein [Halococcus agarilyticus]|uniref:mandelate racemase/muconate lactonizing enzyme family protein n=1 Tax=Halococcus agarilyticus TaxID=1232219 RepID=UPI0006775B14|nr:mandelate racemase/muconate lactonizing enzyme family protein [Halococcus agarilyticus]
MSITAVDAIPVRMDVEPLESDLGLAPYVSNHDSVESVTRMLVRVDTDNGVTGWGEMLVGMKSAAVTKAVVKDVIAPELVGRDVGEIRDFIDSFYFPYVKVRPFVGAVETALWDAFGKTVGQPVHRLLGGKTRDRVEIATCLGILDPEESRTYAERAVEHGFSTLKTKAGPDWREDVERIVAMAEAADGELEFRLDPNQGWAFEDAVRAATRLEEQGILLQYLEQPVRIDTDGTYASLRNRVRTPIAVNEDTYFPRNLRFLLRADAIDAAVVDLVPAGGILRVREQVAMAANAGVSVSHHCGFDLGVKTAAMLHTVASTPSINLPPDSVYYAWEDDVIAEPFEVENGTLPVPDGPGLGVEVDETKIERYRCD